MIQSAHQDLSRFPPAGLWARFILDDFRCRRADQALPSSGNHGESAVSDEFSGKNILLVDDDRDMLDALCAVLDGSGAAIQTAADGDRALELALSEKPDLIVLDAMLPKRSGFLVLEKLKGTGKKRGGKPFVIMITGNSGKRHQVWAESLGVDGYLNKPVRMERLLESMQKLIGNGSAEEN